MKRTRVTLTTVSYTHEADILCMKLEGAGIETFVPDQNMSSAHPLYAGAMGGIRIQIDEQDLPQARDIMAASEVWAEEGIFNCPECASSSVIYDRVSKPFSFLTLLFLGIPLIWSKKQFTCNSCQHKWRDL